MGPNESKVQIHSAIYTTRLSWEFPNVWGLWCAYHPNQKASLRNLQNTSVTFIKGLTTELVWTFFPHATFFLVMWCTEICVKFNLQSSFHARHSTIQRLHGHRPGIKMMRWKLKKCEQKWYKQFSVVTQYFLYPQNFMKWNWDRQTVRNRGNNQISIPAASAAFSPPSFLRGPGGSTPLKKADKETDPDVFARENFWEEAFVMKQVACVCFCLEDIIGDLDFRRMKEVFFQIDILYYTIDTSCP